MYERFTDRARKAVQSAKLLANDGNVQPAHLILGILKSERSVSSHVFKSLDVSEGLLMHNAEQATASKQEIIPNNSLNTIVAQAIEEAKNLQTNYVGTEHLMLGVLRTPEGEKICSTIDLNYKDFYVKLIALLGRTAPEDHPIQELFNLVMGKGDRIESVDIEKEVTKLVKDHRNLKKLITKIKEGILDAGSDQEDIKGFMAWLKNTLEKHES